MDGRVAVTLTLLTSSGSGYLLQTTVSISREIGGVHNLSLMIYSADFCCLSAFVRLGVRPAVRLLLILPQLIYCL